MSGEFVCARVELTAGAACFVLRVFGAFGVRRCCARESVVARTRKARKNKIFLISENPHIDWRSEVDVGTYS